MGDPPPCKRPCSDTTSATPVKRIRNALPFRFPYFIVNKGGLYCHSLIVIDAFPNIAKSSGATELSVIRMYSSGTTWEVSGGPVELKSCRKCLETATSYAVAEEPVSPSGAEDVFTRNERRRAHLIKNLQQNLALSVFSIGDEMEISYSSCSSSATRRASEGFSARSPSSWVVKTARSSMNEVRAAVDINVVCLEREGTTQYDVTLGGLMLEERTDKHAHCTGNSPRDYATK